MAVGFALIDHIHNLIGAGDKTFSASLREREERRCNQIGDSNHAADATQTNIAVKQTTHKGQTLTYGTLFLSSWTDRLVFVTDKTKEKDFKQVEQNVVYS